MATMICQRCGKECERTSGKQKFCVECGKIAQRERNKKSVANRSEAKMKEWNEYEKTRKEKKYYNSKIIISEEKKDEIKSCGLEVSSFFNAAIEHYIVKQALSKTEELNKTEESNNSDKE